MEKKGPILSQELKSGKCTRLAGFWGNLLGRLFLHQIGNQVSRPDPTVVKEFCRVGVTQQRYSMAQWWTPHLATAMGSVNQVGQKGLNGE